MERPLNRCESCPCKKKTHTQTDGRTEAHAHAGNRANAQTRRDGGHAQMEGGWRWRRPGRGEPEAAGSRREPGERRRRFPGKVGGGAAAGPSVSDPRSRTASECV